ncbi:MAG: UDP-N-acetylglucosamine 2-epimerase [Planctomycetota bacterium]|nr:UDP-N-acetylglucosamine 2-epimerase [Planctomycetota bacterium]
MNHRTIAVFTGSRAEYGLLRSVLSALETGEDCRVRLIAGGSHLLGVQPTIEEIRSEREIHAELPMQTGSSRTRNSDAKAVARGVRGMTDLLSSMKPDILLLLGDRIEVFAAATAASILGVRVAHIHGGDVATGVSDDSIRHAVTKLSHLHFPATELSASRIRRMGERPDHVFVVGSPAVDGLDQIPALPDRAWEEFGRPRFIVLLHPTGESEAIEEDRTSTLISTVRDRGRTLLLAPNHDPGREGVHRAIVESGLPFVDHLPRETFIGLLRRASVLVGNSSAGLLECAALGTPSLDIGDRQAGRERPSTAIHVPGFIGPDLAVGLDHALSLVGQGVDDRFGLGQAGQRISRILSDVRLEDVPIRKRWFEHGED